MLPCQRDMPFNKFLRKVACQIPSSHAELSKRYQQSSTHETSSGQSNCNDSDKNASEIVYLQQQDNNLREAFPELVSEVEKELLWASAAFGAKPDAVNLWIGNDQSVTSFHKDHYENLYAVVAGEKVFTLLPPCDSFRMHLQQYPVASYEDSSNGLQAVLQQDSNVLWSPIEDLADGSSSQDLQQYALYHDLELPRPMQVTVRPGELLYLPSLWWHQVEQRAGRDKLVIAVNYWYDMQFDCKYAYFKFVESLVTNAAAADDTREADAPLTGNVES